MLKHDKTPSHIVLSASNQFRFDTVKNTLEASGVSFSVEKENIRHVLNRLFKEELERPFYRFDLVVPWEEFLKITQKYNSWTDKDCTYGILNMIHDIESSRLTVTFRYD